MDTSLWTSTCRDPCQTWDQDFAFFQKFCFFFFSLRKKARSDRFLSSALALLTNFALY
jgi:hypothetical protein